MTAHLGVRRRPDEQDRIAVLEDLAALDEDPSINFGRWQESIPGAVIAASTEAQLAHLVAELVARGVPYRCRGAGHCSGSLGLAGESEVLLDLRHLAIEPLAHAPDVFSIPASATLETLVDQLAARGRRPVGLPTNLAQTIGGTISVGGFTESCHLYGLFADAVVAARMITLDGQLVDVAPGDTHFDSIPGAAGENGIVTAVALRSLPGRMQLVARRLYWRTLEEMLDDAIRIARLRLYGYFRPRLVSGEYEVEAVAGNFATTVDSAVPFLHRAAISELEPFDLENAQKLATRTPKPFASPALELVFPVPDDRDAAFAFAREAHRRFRPFLPLGIALALAPAQQRYPHLPLPRNGWGLMIAVRPQLAPREAVHMVTELRDVGARMRSAALTYRVSI